MPKRRNRSTTRSSNPADDQRTPNRRARNDASFRRPAASRSPRLMVLIVCEGTETEPRYFHAWRTRVGLTTITIRVVDGAGQANQVINTAIAQRNERRRTYQRAHQHGQSADPPFDAIWCVFDREARYELATFQQAVHRADQEQIQLAISNPSFEYWYLLHFRDTGAFFDNSAAVQRELRRYLPAYQKAQDVFPQVYPMTDTAMERAERQYQQHPERMTDRFPNPSTTVYQLVRLFRPDPGADAATEEATDSTSSPHDAFPPT